MAGPPLAARRLQVPQAAPLGLFTLDFYCPAAKLCVEVDGDSHSMGNRPTHDEARDALLARKYIATLRIDAADLYGDIESAVQHILTTCRTRVEQRRRPNPPCEAQLHGEGDRPKDGGGAD